MFDPEDSMFRLACVALCAMTLWGSAAARAAADWPPAAPDLAISIVPSSPACLEADDCTFLVRIENLGAAAYDGPIGFKLVSSVAAVSGPNAQAPWSCRKDDFGKFSCATPTASLAPGKSADLMFALRMLPTPQSRARDCASLDWTGERLELRDGVLHAAFEALGQKASPSSTSSDALRALIGNWGDGDLRAENDQDCASIAIEPPAPPPACQTSEAQVDGQCVSLANYCTAGRSFDGAKGQCSCPADRPAFDPVTRSCGANVAALECGGGRKAVNGLCACPLETPLWNETAGACQAMKRPEAKVETAPPAQPKAQSIAPKVATAEPPPEPEPVVKPAKQKTTRVCSPGRVLRDGLCVRNHVRRSARAIAPRRTAQAGKCPPLFSYNRRANYCWPALWLDPDILVHGPIPRQP